jgi:hypothetical protein
MFYTHKQRIAVDVDAATRLQRWRRAHHPRRHFTFGRSPVAVRAIQQLYRRRAIVELCLKTYAVQGNAARVLQGSPRAQDDSNRESSPAPKRRQTTESCASSTPLLLRKRKDRVFIDSLGMASPSLFRSLDIETFISPIKPIPDGWDESIPDGWDDDDDDDLLEGL